MLPKGSAIEIGNLIPRQLMNTGPQKPIRKVRMIIKAVGEVSVEARRHVRTADDPQGSPSPFGAPDLPVGNVAIGNGMADGIEIAQILGRITHSRRHEHPIPAIGTKGDTANDLHEVRQQAEGYTVAVAALAGAPRMEILGSIEVGSTRNEVTGYPFLE